MRITVGDIEAVPLQPQDGTPIKLSFVETRVELEDSLWQIFSEPKEITLMNVDRHERIVLPLKNEPGSPFTYWFDLSKEIKKESR